MGSQPQNPEFRNNPENFHPCIWLDISCESSVGSAGILGEVGKVSK